MGLARMRVAGTLALLALSGCWVPLERGRLMEARIQRLEVEGAEQEARLAEQQRALKERIGAADKKLAEVQQKLDELNQAARRSGADLGVQLSRLQDDFARARGELEVARHELDQMKKAVEALDQKSEKRFAALRGRGALDEMEAKEKLQALPNDDKAAVLQLAQAQEASGSKGVAREVYEEYVRRWPSDPAAADASFRSAELAFGQKRWREALVSYGWIYEKAPRSERVPDAMLGMAEAMLELDELKKDAPAVLKELIEKHPKSPAAGRAKQRLAELAPSEKKKPADPAAGKKAPAPKKK